MIVNVIIMGYFSGGGFVVFIVVIYWQKVIVFDNMVFEGVVLKVYDLVLSWVFGVMLENLIQKVIWGDFYNEQIVWFLFILINIKGYVIIGEFLVLDRL